MVSEAWEACVVYHPELFEPYIQAVQQKLRVSDRALQAMYQGGGLQILDSQAKEMDCKQLGAGLLQVWRMLEELDIKYVHLIFSLFERSARWFGSFWSGNVWYDRPWRCVASVDITRLLPIGVIA